MGLGDILRLIPQLFVTFVGVFSAFWLDRFLEQSKKGQVKKNLRHLLRSELERISQKLDGKGHLHFPDIWKSAVNSGQLLLLDYDQIDELARIYCEVQAIEYEAKRCRALGEAYRTTLSKDILPEWSQLTKIIRQREAKLEDRIKKALKKDWW